MQSESQNYQTNQNQRLIRSFGRVKSRRLSDHKSFLLKNYLPKFEISDVDFKADFTASETNNFSKKSFEIGFGFGDFLYEKAKSTPNQLFLGCEPHINGIVNVLGKLETQHLNNIKLSRDDARELLQKFPDDFFDEIYILFPDPWPKIKHFKRRLINVDLLDNLCAKKIKSKGKIIIATDHDSYKTWILCEISKSQQFNWQADCKDDWQKFPADWIETKYQKKAAKEGRISVIFTLQKNS